MNLPATSEKRHPFAPTCNRRILREGNTPGRQPLLDDILEMDWFADSLNLVGQALYPVEDSALYICTKTRRRGWQEINNQSPESLAGNLLHCCLRQSSSCGSSNRVDLELSLHPEHAAETVIFLSYITFGRTKAYVQILLFATWLAVTTLQRFRPFMISPLAFGRLFLQRIPPIGINHYVKNMKEPWRALTLLTPPSR